MESSSTSQSGDTSPLLPKGDESCDQPATEPLTIEAPFNPFSILPISFLLALGMAATAATSIFAYASLLCKNPTHCEASEQKDYASSVALSISIANVCGILVLSSLEKISRTHLKLGLALWIVCRFMSVAVLALGVYFRSIRVALSGRVFQGLASDNLLHFNLNTVYVRTAADEGQVSRLIGASLAMFMVGISISPAIAGLFQDFATSFFMAGGIFAFSLLYLVVFVGRVGHRFDVKETLQRAASADRAQPVSICGNKKAGLLGRVTSVLRGLFSPLQLFYSRPATLMSGLALLIYTSVQSYIFSLIMVHTSLEFGFTGKQNGFILTIVHAVAATYLLTVLFIIPRLTSLRASSHRPTPEQQTRHEPTRDANLALVSLFMQILALLGFANASKTWEVYAISAISALGLATPSFIKSHFLAFFGREESGRALGALTMMETVGSLLSPLLMGAWQVLRPGSSVFYGAAGMMGLAALCFCSTLLILRDGSRQVQMTAP